MAWSKTFHTFADDLVRAGGDRRRRQDVLREIGKLYTAGMGGIQDLVLQDEHGVKPEQDTFGVILHLIFVQMQNELGSGWMNRPGESGDFLV